LAWLESVHGFFLEMLFFVSFACFACFALSGGCVSMER